VTLRPRAQGRAATKAGTGCRQVGLELEGDLGWVHIVGLFVIGWFIVAVYCGGVET
jgi:hypothetical protein